MHPTLRYCIRTTRMQQFTLPFGGKQRISCENQKKRKGMWYNQETNICLYKDTSTYNFSTERCSYMLAILLLGSLLLFSLIIYILKWISGRSGNAERSTGRVLQIVLCVSILVLAVQDYIFAELPHNGVFIATLITMWYATMVPDRAPVSNKTKEANRTSE